MKNLFVKTGDQVVITSGANKGKQGKVLQVFPKLNRVVVEGANLTKRHLKSRRQGDKGQIVEFPMPIHASNVKRLETEAAPAKPAAKTAKAKKTS